LNKSNHRNRAVGECIRCLIVRRSFLAAKMICHPCFIKEQKNRCLVCGKEKRFVIDGGGVCPDCIRRNTGVTEIECVRCGKRKPPANQLGKYCEFCQGRVNFGRGICSGCGKDKPYIRKTKKLCNNCTLTLYAPNRLKRFIETTRMSNEYNRSLFQHLVELIDWDRVNNQVLSRYKEFGRFLQRHEFAGPLTWESILKLKAELPGLKLRAVRSCLDQLGDTLINPAIDESIEATKKRIRPLGPISQIEGPDLALMHKYDCWLRTERNITSTARCSHFMTLARFRRWFIARGLTSVTEVENAHVEEYLHTNGLKWRCECCGSSKMLNTRGEMAPSECESLDCRAQHSYRKVIRCTKETVSAYGSILRVFFGWLKDVEQGIKINPAPRLKTNRRKRGKRSMKAVAAIQCYEWELIRSLLSGIESPDTPAEEAIALYFVVHHGCSFVELMTLRVPLQCRPTALGSEPSEPLENVLIVEWEDRELSRGRQSPSRTGKTLALEPSDEPWLRDLIRRFMRERNYKLRDPNNPYLFIATYCSPRSGSVSRQHLRRLIERATARITGRVCNVRTLKKSSRLLYSEFGGHESFRHLQELGLGKNQARLYAWAKRVKVVPRRASQTTIKTSSIIKQRQPPAGA